MMPSLADMLCMCPAAGMLTLGSLGRRRAMQVRMLDDLERVAMRARQRKGRTARAKELEATSMREGKCISGP